MAQPPPKLVETKPKPLGNPLRSTVTPSAWSPLLLAVTLKVTLAVEFTVAVAVNREMLRSLARRMVVAAVPVSLAFGPESSKVPVEASVRLVVPELEEALVGT